MKHKILEFISTFNKEKQITIEYAVMEALLDPTGITKYNILFVFSPTREFLVSSYLSGNNIESMYEKTVTGDLSSILIKDISKLKSTVSKPTHTLDTSDIASLTFVNLTRFCNFKFTSLNDPFLSMFLNDSNIVYMSEEFKTHFFDLKENFKPSSIYLFESVKQIFNGILAKSKEYNFYYDLKVVKDTVQNLHKAMQLYFSILTYHSTGNLQYLFEEKYDLILNTLANSFKPWEFVQECVNHIDTIARLPENISRKSAQLEQTALTNECEKFLHNKLIGE